MTQAATIEKMQSVFNDVFLEPPTLTPALTATEVAEWDSLLHISLLLAIEKAFGIRFRVGEVEATKNIGDFADLIKRGWRRNDFGFFHHSVRCGIRAAARYFDRAAGNDRSHRLA